MQNSTKLYSIVCLILVICTSYATSQPSFQQPGAPPNIGGFPQGPGGPAIGGFPQAPSGFPQGPGGPAVSGFPQAQGPSPGGFPQGPGAGFANGAGGANSFNAYNSFGNNLGGLGGFGAANPGLGGLGGLGAANLGGLGGLNAANPGLGGFGVPNARAGGFGAGTPAGFGNVGFGQPAVQSAAPFRAANTQPNAPAATFQANPLTSIFGGGQNIGAGMSVDQMRTLDNALFGNGANIFQTEQPSATFSYPLNQRVQQQTYQTVPDTTNTYTTQQFGAGPMMGPGATPFGPGMATPGPGIGGFGNPAASSLLNSALLNGMGGGMSPYGYGQQSQQQQQVNPAYSSLTTGFNDLLTGVGSGLTNAGRDIASGYAPPSLNPNPTTGYTQNTAARTPISPGNPVATANDADVPMRTTNPSNYGTSAQNTFTATYPGVGLVDLGVPIIGHQSTETADSPTRFRTSTSATPPLQSAERVSIMQAKRQQVN
jgi:hypothetical protein